jgi:ABC-type glycerol-3-phosphate transport system substrate-binding protein
MNRRVLMAGAAVGVLALTMSACGGGSGSGGKSSAAGQVTVWTITQPSSAQKVVQGLVDKFNKSYPGGGHVTLSWIGGEPYKQKIAVAMAGHHPPTIFLTYGGQLLEQYVKGGNVADVSKELNADQAWKGQYVAKDVFGLATFNNKIYGIPESGPDYELMWQNKSVLRKAGAQPSPATWSEFETAMSAVKKSGAAPE